MTKDTFKNKERYILVMGRKKRVLDIWIFITAIIGASFLIFNNKLGESFLQSGFFIWFGIIFLIISVIISLSKAWK